MAEDDPPLRPEEVFKLRRIRRGRRAGDRLGLSRTASIYQEQTFGFESAQRASIVLGDPRNVPAGQASSTKTSSLGKQVWSTASRLLTSRVPYSVRVNARSSSCSSRSKASGCTPDDGEFCYPPQVWIETRRTVASPLPRPERSISMQADARQPGQARPPKANSRRRGSVLPGPVQCRSTAIRVEISFPRENRAFYLYKGIRSPRSH